VLLHTFTYLVIKSNIAHSIRENILSRTVRRVLTFKYAVCLRSIAKQTSTTSMIYISHLSIFYQYIQYLTARTAAQYFSLLWSSASSNRTITAPLIALIDQTI